MEGNIDYPRRVLARQTARDVELAKKYRSEGQYDRVVDLFQADLHRALLLAVNRSGKVGEAR